MRFLSVAERELRAAARRKGTYRVRWITAMAFFGLLVWMTWAFDGFTRRGAAPTIFKGLSVMTFFYCVFVGATQTADCLSREKREGTLGLLFLTNLNSADVVAGKLCSSALTAIYGLCAIFPLLALPLLLGGVSFGYFWRTVLALANALFFSVAIGFAASVLSVRQFPAIGLATGVSLCFCLGLMGAAEALSLFGCPAPWVEATAVLSPLYALTTSEGSRRVFGQNRYWLSLALVASTSSIWLAVTVWRLGRTWRDRDRGVRVFGRSVFLQRWRLGGKAGRVTFRRRLLTINPFYWLASRQLISAPVFMLLTFVLVAITVGVTSPYFGKTMGSGALNPLLGHLFAWLWTGLAIHALALYCAATAAAQRLAEEKESGALELILSTSATDRCISRGLWLAYGRRVFVPVAVASLVHFFFVWHAATLFLLDSPAQLPLGLTAGQLIWNGLFDRPIHGINLEWPIGLMMRILMLALAVQIGNWLTLGWLGRWLGLRMKHPGFAPITAVALVLVPPVLLFSVLCYAFNQLGLDRLPERRLLPLMMWLGFGIGMGNCFLLSAWAAGRWRRDFRTTVTSRFQPPPLRRWWRPTRRSCLRFAVGTALLALLVLGFYGYQNWRSRRAWEGFQAELKRRGESLDLSALLPAPVSDAQNFARTAVFRGLLNRNHDDHSPAGSLLDALNRRYPDSAIPNSVTPPRWIQQGFTELNKHAVWIQPDAGPITSTNLTEAAAAVLDGLQPLATTLADAAAAASLPFFQYSTNRDAEAVLERERRALAAIERLHFLFEVRSSARLALNRPAEADEDLLASLRLVQLARQSADARASTAVQTMLAGSLQPLWEGFAERRWTEPQIGAFQALLEGFDLVADHTNAIRRIVRAYIERWGRISAGRPQLAPPSPRVGWPDPTPAQRLQPRAWWFDNCIQLYRAGEKAIAQADALDRRPRGNDVGEDLNGLPLDGDHNQVLLQGSWWGANPDSVDFAQTALNQAIIACALERYRLVTGAYPKNLEQLVPGYLRAIPPDILRGGPMLYERTEAGRYILRGVGPNGISEQNKKGSDDWLWAYPEPTNAPPTPTVANPR